MNTKNGVVVGVIAVVALVVGTYAFMQSGDAAMEANRDESSLMAQKETIMDESRSSETSNTNEEMPEAAEMSAGSYEAYAPEKLARAEEGDVVLFFHASWCPSCRGLNADIEQNLGSIPSALSILKVNYDTETELKKKYGITYQHTLVQVDKEGMLIKKWSGSPSLSALVAEVQ